MKEKLKKFWNEERTTILITAGVCLGIVATVKINEISNGKTIDGVNDFLNDDGNQVILITLKNGSSQAFTKVTG